MRRIMMILAITILFGGFTITDAKSSPGIFSLEDTRTKIRGVSLDMEKGALEKILGKPQNVKKHFEGAFGADVIYYGYDFGEIRLEPVGNDHYTVASISLSGSNITGPRGIKIGDKLNDVLSKFPYDRDAVLEKQGVLLVKYVYGKPKKHKYPADGDEGFAGGYGYIEYNREKRPVALRFFYSYYYFCLKIQEDRVVSMVVGANNV